MEVEKNRMFFDSTNTCIRRPQNSLSFEVSGICSICGRPGKMHTCSLCGILVCRDCYDQSKSVCKLCKKNPGKKM